MAGAATSGAIAAPLQNTGASGFYDGQVLVPMPPVMAPSQTGGLTVAQPNGYQQTATGQASISPAAPMNAYGQASQAYQGALGGTVAAGQMPDIAAFQNPYTRQVIERTQADIERQRQMAANQLGAQATAARAFGGSRQGVAEGVLGGEYARMAGDIAAQQRQAGFNTALAAAQQQRGQQLAAAGQLGNLAQTGFGFGQAITQQQAQQGALQQALQQALIDAARGQYAGFTGAPQQALALPLQALGAAPIPQTTTQTRRPGLFDYLTLGAAL